MALPILTPYLNPTIGTLTDTDATSVVESLHTWLLSV